MTNALTAPLLDSPSLLVLDLREVHRNALPLSITPSGAKVIIYRRYIPFWIYYLLIQQIILTIKY
jgi:hypothetical protein